VPSTNWVFTQNPDGTIVFQFPHLIEARFLKVKTIWDDRNLDNESIDEASVGNVATELVKVWALKKTQFAQYEYDNQGNRIKLTVDGDAHGYIYYRNGAGGNLSWLASDGTWYYRYDDNGNLVTKAKQATIDTSSRDFTVDTSQEYWNYTWDLHNRLASVSKNGSLLVSYAYDVDNLRVSRTKGTETTVYAYGRTGAITYQKNLATRVARTYRYLCGETVGWTDTAADGMTTPMYSATDHQGSVTQVTNASATVVWSSEYQPFGKTAGVEGLYDFDGSYAGHQVDIDTGLIYMWNRWQDPETGRFISEDPAQWGDNFYAYANNSTLVFGDPTGLEPHNGASDGYQSSDSDHASTYENTPGTQSYDVTHGTSTSHGSTGVAPVTISWTGEDVFNNQHGDMIYVRTDWTMHVTPIPQDPVTGGPAGNPGPATGGGGGPKDVRTDVNVAVLGAAIKVLVRLKQFQDFLFSGPMPNQEIFDSGMNALSILMMFADFPPMGPGMQLITVKGGSWALAKGGVLGPKALLPPYISLMSGEGGGSDNSSTSSSGNSSKGRLKKAGLPTSGKIRFVPPEGYNPESELPRGPRHGYIDRFGNEWVKGPGRGGDAYEWDVQLSRSGKSQLGWASNDGNQAHINVSVDGELTH